MRVRRAGLVCTVGAVRFPVAVGGIGGIGAVWQEGREREGWAAESERRERRMGSLIGRAKRRGEVRESEREAGCAVGSREDIRFAFFVSDAQ